MTTYGGWRTALESTCTVTWTGIRYDCVCGKYGCHNCLDITYYSTVNVTGEVNPDAFETIISPFPPRPIGETYACLVTPNGLNAMTAIYSRAAAVQNYNSGTIYLIFMGLWEGFLFLLLMCWVCVGTKADVPANVPANAPAESDAMNKDVAMNPPGADDVPVAIASEEGTKYPADEAPAYTAIYPPIYPPIEEPLSTSMMMLQQMKEDRKAAENSLANV
jgi:hypothetical protein